MGLNNKNEQKLNETRPKKCVFWAWILKSNKKLLTDWKVLGKKRANEMWINPLQCKILYTYFKA